MSKCRFTHNVTQTDSTASEFIRFLQYSPEALPLAAVSTWNQQISIHSITYHGDFLYRFPAIGFLNIPNIPGITLGPLSRLLSSHKVASLHLGIVGNATREEDALEDDMVPVPSVLGLVIELHSPDHGRISLLFAQKPTVFPNLSSLFLMDCRSQCSNAPSGPPFSTTADEVHHEPPELARFAAGLLAACLSAGNTTSQILTISRYGTKSRL